MHFFVMQFAEPCSTDVGYVRGYPYATYHPSVTSNGPRSVGNYSLTTPAHYSGNLAILYLVRWFFFRFFLCADSATQMVAKCVVCAMVATESRKVWKKVWSFSSLEKSGKKFLGLFSEEKGNNFPDLIF